MSSLPSIKQKLTLMVAAFALLLLALFAASPQAAWAAEDDIASGTCGTCVWVIDSEGTLTISPEDGESGTLEDIYGTDAVPWYSDRADIKSVVVDSGVKTGQYCRSLFRGCSKLTSVDLGELDTSEAKSVESMFYGCSRLKSVDISSLDLSKVEDATSLFQNCSVLSRVELDGVNFASLVYAESVFSGCVSLGEVSLGDGCFPALSYASRMFEDCRSLGSIDLSLFADSEIKEMNSMFSGCESLSSVDLSGLSFPKATRADEMFSDCSGLEQVSLSGARFPRLDRMDSMFWECTSLEQADLSNLSVRGVSSLSYLFYGCEKLSSVSLNGLDCSAASSTDGMFEDCDVLSEVDFSKVSASGLQSANYMFLRCCSLKEVDLSGMDSTVTSCRYMFGDCENLVSIYDDGGLSFLSSEDVFYGCEKLRGGNGTAYSDSMASVKYARIDKPGQVGYFTCKHSDLKKVDEIAPSSGQEGTSAHYECISCEKLFGDSSAKKELKSEDLVLHAWGDYSSNGDATCAKDGTKTRECSACGERETVTDEGSRVEHKPGKTKIENAKEATCTEDGSHDEVVYCATCGEELSRNTVADPKLGHDYSETVVAPTCTEDGYTAHECSRCGDSYEDSVTKAEGHKPGDAKAEKVKDPTCTEKGSHDEVTYCTACGTELSRKAVEDAATGHAWGDYSSNGDATCAKDGTKTRECTACGERETVTDEGSKTAHAPGKPESENAIAATCTEDGSHDEVVYCATCGEELSRNTVADHKLGHDETIKTQLKQASTSTDGCLETKHVCKRCGLELSSEKSDIPAVKSVSLSNARFTYSGKQNRPSIKVSDSKGFVLRQNVDYVVSYQSDGKGVGSYSVTVKGKGNYSFAKALTFIVNPKGANLSKVSAAKKAFTAKWSKRTSQTTGYQLRYSTKSSMAGAKTSTVKSVKTTSKKVSKLKKKTKYYVQVRTYKVVKGKTYYSDWSKTKSVKTK